MCAGQALAGDAAIVSPWLEGFNNKARLHGGQMVAAGKPALFAGVEVAMPSGWKTYWRAPGESGIPPEFDWSGSENLESATVLYPAPHRLIDKGGTNIGYKDRVLFPVSISAKDPAKPVTLKLKAAYGVCKDICIPAEAELALDVPAGAGPSAEIEEAFKLVPGAPDAGKDPLLTAWRIDKDRGKPKLVLEVQDPGGEDGDAFVFVADGTYLPLPKKIAGAAGKSTFEIDLTDGVDLAALKGKTVLVTLTGAKGQSETAIKID